MFLEEVSEKIGMDIGGVVKGFRYTNINNSVLIIEANTKIELYNTCKIILSFGKSKIIVVGTNLRLYEFNKSEVCIKGKITCVSDSEVSI